MVYGLRYLNAPAKGLLRFQALGWASTLGLIAFQSSCYGFTAQQETLGLQITLMGLSAYLGFAP